MASITKRKNKDGSYSWRALVRLKGYPSASKNFERKQEAEDWSREIESDIKRGQYNFSKANTQYTFEDLVRRHESDGLLEHLKSVNSMKLHLNYWVKRFKGYALIHITPEFIGQERKRLAQTPSSKGGKPLSSSTINRYMANLSSVLSYATRDLRWIQENPCRCIRKLKEAPGRDRTLSVDEATRLLQSCRQSKSMYVYAVMLMAITTGMRQGEILSLNWADIDFENGLAHIRTSKNGRPRSAALSPALVEELKRLHKLREVHKPLAFASRTAFGKLDIKKAFSEACKRAKITGFKFHDTRHTFSTMAAGMGASQLVLKAGTGHQTLQMLDRYTHLDAVATRQYSERIAKEILK